MLEDIELGVERGAQIEVSGIPAAPAEGAARDPFETGEIDLMPAQKSNVLFGKVAAHHPGETNRRQEGGGHREERGRSTQDIDPSVGARLHRVEGDGTDD